MFRCEISKAIWNDNKKTDIHEVLVKSVELPFPPYIGLSISAGRFHSGELKSIEWDVDKEVFCVRVGDEIPWEDEDSTDRVHQS